MKTIDVFLADDHQILRESLVILLSQREGIRVVGEAADGREAFEKIMLLRPSIAVLDISIPRLNGIELAAKLAQEAPQIKTVVLTMHKSEEFVMRALCAGVRGYVLKDNALEELIACIEAVERGEMFLSKSVTRLVVGELVKERRIKEGDQPESLTSREREVLQLLAEGRSNRDISETLTLSVKTVETHRANIMRKLGLKNIADLVLYAVRNHIIEP
ncbi:MAG TPA: response regulator transcription factor [Clostridia bacterium]|nr:response regulator transcription factor [Clostridia bacterium]